MATEITYEKLFRGGYRATLGAFSECGPTMKAARESLLALFAAIPSDTEPVVLTDSQGGQWVTWFDGRAWWYRCGSARAVVLTDAKSRQDCVDRMRSHMKYATE